MSGSPYDAQCQRCVPQETSIRCVQLATAYVPFQKYCGVWSMCKSLLTGTAFPELFSPYCKREYANLEPEVTCPAGGPCGRVEGRACRG